MALTVGGLTQENVDVTVSNVSPERSNLQLWAKQFPSDAVHHFSVEWETNGGA
jgi:hypothetical protein